MADRRQFEALYQSIARDLQKMKGELMNEVKYSAAQTSAMVNQANSEKGGATAAIAQEIRYGYKQNQNVYDGIAAMVKNEISARLNSVDQKLCELEKLQQLLNELGDIKGNYLQLQAVCEGLAAVVSNDVLSKIEKTSEDIRVHNEQVLDALANAADPVDYTRIVDEVGDKVLELLNEVKPEPVSIDYDRIVDSTVEKVVESMPYPEKIDMEALANVVASKVVVPEIDYDRLADLVAEKMSAKEQAYDVVIDEEGIDQIAEKVAQRLSVDAIDYNRIAEVVEEKLGVEESEETSYELVLDEDGISAIAKCVAEELRATCCVCECEPVAEEEPAVEEAPAEEELAVAEEVVEEPVVEEIAEEAPVEEELAVAATPSYEEIEDGQLVDAETGLIVRLKKSFTAKMKQSDEKVKEYYSALKNELTSYKKINSNVSWHGDRFNFGRDTVAKINIVGKTLGVYLALDPNDPEYKTTVYHQKDVGNQKAYENTPFMVKVKSDAAVKKATRLIVSLAEKLGTEKEASFEEVDYVAEFAYESTKQLFEEGYIKATKEKKVDLNF